MRKHTKALIWRRSITQEYCTDQIPPAIQTRSFSYGLLLPVVWLAWPWGQLLTLLPLHFLLSLPAASPLFSTAPWKGGWNKCYQPSRRQTAPFCLWLLLYRRAFMAQRKPASVETTMASERTSPSPLLLTHTLHAAGSTYKWRGAYGGWPVWHVHNDNTGCRWVYASFKADHNWDAAEHTEVHLEWDVNQKGAIWLLMNLWSYICTSISRHAWLQTQRTGPDFWKWQEKKQELQNQTIQTLLFTKSPPALLS